MIKIYPYKKNRVHIRDKHNRKIYFMKNRYKTWLCDINSNNEVPNLWFVNSGRSYNYDINPSHKITYPFKICEE